MEKQFQLARVLDIDALTLEQKTDLINLMRRFIEETGTTCNDVGKNYEALFMSLHYGLTGLWVVLHATDKHLVGYGIAEISEAKKYCFVWQVYLTVPGFFKEGFRAMMGWAREHKVHRIVMRTRRGDRAYARLLRTVGFERSEIEYEVKI